MTTEILRSMLYRGSDIVRDVQCVIFDEVHYLNDSERGVVWEEVIIMLNSNVSMVFLSATTPNTVEFCDWIGRTKARQVFVTGTKKRPVPLQHFLFHGEGCFKLMHGDTGFMPTAVAAAAKAEKLRSQPKPATAENAGMKAQRAGEKSAIAAQNRGGPPSKSGGRGGGGGGGAGAGTSASVSAGSKKPALEGSKAQWLSLLRLLQGGGREAAGGLPAVDFGDAVTAPRYATAKANRHERDLQTPYERLPLDLRQAMTKKEYEATQVRADGQSDVGSDEGGLLPAVAFCFSKKKCEDICDHFNSQDMLTAAQKGRVRAVFEGVHRRLSIADSRLPQVLRVEERAKRGVGVHHGGLLPILKEAVEVLFSQGLIKVLVATETFAMGVNMPARYVCVLCAEGSGVFFHAQPSPLANAK